MPVRPMASFRSKVSKQTEPVFRLRVRIMEDAEIPAFFRMLLLKKCAHLADWAFRKMPRVGYLGDIVRLHDQIGQAVRTPGNDNRIIIKPV